MPRKTKKNRPEVVGMLGIGLDNNDDHTRVTRSEDFLIVGGSEETHERMQDVAIRFEESLKERGKRLREVEPDEVIDLLRKANEK